ncbi:Signal transduction response regulator [Heracleum sosnowskyi]|uniref:Signal transduction response regulator n=1 Tax=Heracleum sosnowskyi TaxID=360622 RepID=A0AAD8GXS2_9APIA|nr:Signal transduction response regulator [Heracleum sosnowskyi]
MAKKVKSSNKSKLSALVVDDNSTCRLAHCAILRRHEFETYTAENGREVVELIRSGQKFDVIFIDTIMTPEMNGVQATRALRLMGVNSMIVGMDCDLDHINEDFIRAGMDRVYKKRYPMRYPKKVPLRVEIQFI